MWIDAVSNTDSSGTTTFGDFETNAVGDEVIFQEPSFSSTTSANLLAAPDVAEVTAAMAFTGTQSLLVDWEFVDDDPSRWLRLTTADADHIPNPLIHLRDGDYDVDANGIVQSVTFTPTTITFWAKALIIPESSSFTLGLLGLALLVSHRRCVR